MTRAVVLLVALPIVSTGSVLNAARTSDCWSSDYPGDVCCYPSTAPTCWGEDQADRQMKTFCCRSVAEFVSKQLHSGEALASAGTLSRTCNWPPDNQSKNIETHVAGALATWKFRVRRVKQPKESVEVVDGGASDPNGTLVAHVSHFSGLGNVYNCSRVFETLEEECLRIDLAAEDRDRILEWWSDKMDRFSRRRWGKSPPSGFCGRMLDVPRGKHYALDIFDELEAQGHSSWTGWLVNFGAGTHLDPIYLLANHTNFSGIFIDPQAPGDGLLAHAAHVAVVQEFATPSNLCKIFRAGGQRLPPACEPSKFRTTFGDHRVPVDFLKVDIDSFDCALLEAVLQLLAPVGVFVEINLAFPPPLRFSRSSSALWSEAVRGMSDIGRMPLGFGCSLAEAVRILGASGLGLYGLQDIDAIFLRADVLSKLRGRPSPARGQQHSHPDNHGRSSNFASGWSPSVLEADFVSVSRSAGVDETACYKEALARGVWIGADRDFVREWLDMLTQDPGEVVRRVWCNLTLHDSLFGFAGIPFTLSLS